MKAIFQSYKVLMFAIVCLISSSVWAQEISRTINLRADLGSVIQLNIDPDVRLEFGIKEINDKLYQISKYPDDVVFSVESTEDWTLSIAATTPYFRGVKDSTLTIPIEFIGFTIENHGNNYDNGKFSNIYNPTKDTSVILSTNKTMILTNGRRHNIGNAKDNYFVLRWKLRYHDDLLKLKQLYNFKLTDELFRVGVRLTLTRSLTPLELRTIEKEKEE